MTLLNFLRISQAKFYDIILTYFFLSQSPKAIEIKTKTNKWGLIKHTGFCTAKKTINKAKRKTYRMEIIFAKDVTGKGLISKIHK